MLLQRNTAKRTWKPHELGWLTRLAEVFGELLRLGGFTTAINTFKEDKASPLRSSRHWV